MFVFFYIYTGIYFLSTDKVLIFLFIYFLFFYVGLCESKGSSA